MLGIAGARSVKWLQSIKLSRKPSESPWNSYYYRRNDGSHIQELPINSIILSPKNGNISINKNEMMLHVEGVAYSSGNGIQKVEVRYGFK